MPAALLSKLRFGAFSVHRAKVPAVTDSSVNRLLISGGQIASPMLVAAPGAIVFTRILNFSPSRDREFIKPTSDILALE